MNAFVAGCCIVGAALVLSAIMISTAILWLSMVIEKSSKAKQRGE